MNQHGHYHHAFAFNRAFAIGIALNLGFVVVEAAAGWMAVRVGLVVLIAGGKGELSAGRRMPEEMGGEGVPLVGVAKGAEHGGEGREVFHLLDGRESTLSGNDPVLC